jgi:dTMP kinase
MKNGKFIVIDGPDGSGKSTQVKLLAVYLIRRGYRVCVVREPGSTAIGEKIRRILLDTKHKQMTPATELFLYMASRAQLVAEIIKPALKQGKIVIADRFLSSSIAYQGYGGNLDCNSIKQMGKIATGGLKPDLMIIYDVNPNVGLKRIKKGFRKTDRIEKKQLAFHRRVWRGFQAIAKSDSSVKVISALPPAVTTHSATKTIVGDFLANS